MAFLGDLTTIPLCALEVVLDYLDLDSLKNFRLLSRTACAWVNLIYPVFTRFLPKVLDVMHLVFENRQNVFITGPGGCGKTTLVKAIQKEAATRDMVVRVIAPTHMACQLFNGTACTIHSFCKIGLTKTSEKFVQWLDRVYLSRNRKPRINRPDILIVDEVSMMGASLLFAMNTMLQLSWQNVLPMGGVQVVFVGDFMQLPPVRDKCAFGCKEWADLELVRMDLTYSLRQRLNGRWFNLLSEIRSGEHEVIPPIIQSREVDPGKVDEMIEAGSVLLSADNKRVEYHNDHFFAANINPVERELHARDRFFRVEKVNGVNVRFFVDTQPPKVPDIWRAPPILRLKIGARYLITENVNPPLGAINGRGCSYMGNYIFMMDNGRPVHLGQLRATFICPVGGTLWILRHQVALRLGYAITIHKSQGMTLDSVICDGTVWRANMPYVAFSRVRDICDLHLVHLRQKRLPLLRECLEFYGHGKRRKREIDV